MKQISIVSLLKEDVDEQEFVTSVKEKIQKSFEKFLLKDVDYYVKNIPKKIERG